MFDRTMILSKLCYILQGEMALNECDIVLCEVFVHWLVFKSAELVSNFTIQDLNRILPDQIENLVWKYTQRKQNTCTCNYNMDCLFFLLNCTYTVL